MKNAINYLETVSKFEILPDDIAIDAVETVTITEAHHALYLGAVEVLTEAYKIHPDPAIEILITKYTKRL